MVTCLTGSKSIFTIKLPVQSNQYFMILHHNMWGYLFEIALLMNSGSLVLKEGSALQIGLFDATCFQVVKWDYVNMVWITGEIFLLSITVFSVGLLLAPPLNLNSCSTIVSHFHYFNKYTVKVFFSITSHILELSDTYLDSCMCCYNVHCLTLQ